MALDEKANEKSRRERRKEARLEKNKKKFNSWVQHQQSRKSNKTLVVSEPKDATRSQNDSKKAQLMNSDDEDMFDEVEPELKQRPTKENTVTESNGPKRRNVSVKKPKTKFKEYLEMEMNGDLLTSKEDLRLEKKLAKKLKVKGGRVPGMEDDIGELLEGIPSALDFLEEGKEIVTGVQKEAPSKKRKKSKMENEVDNNLIDNGVAEDSYGESGESDSYDDENQDNEEDVFLAKKPKKINSKKTKFEEYLEAEMQKGGVPADDLDLERKLAKKLKVKKGGLSGDDDAINELLEGIPSVIEKPEESKPKINVASVDEERVLVKAPADPDVSCSKKYIAPHIRRNNSEEHAQMRKQLRGLLNRLSESNVESVTGQISTMFRLVGRSIGSQLIGQEVLAFCCGGPRGNEQYAAVFAAFVAGMACSVGVDFGAKLLSSLAKSFEDEYAKEDNLSLRNLTLLLSYLYKFGVCSSDLIYDFLITLSKRMTEVDVSTILTVLQSCGMRLRSDDPVGMKNFILSVQSRVNELKATSEEGQSNNTSKRMEFMLETICDIKNNKTRSKEDNVQQTRIKKWLQKLRVNDILLRGLSWSKLLDPEKKGQWWSCGDNASNSDHVEEVAGRIDMDVPETQKMLQLAAAQRMNTDARRAIFCVIMSGEDYIDAFEKLLRLDLPGKQDREIIRVLVDCCLQERVFNKYYCVLASKLCSHDKNHKFTLQYCLWDHFKKLESMELDRSFHLAKFVAEMVASFSISLAVLKVVDFSDVAQLTPKRIMHFRMLFEAILEFPEKIIWNIFTRIAVTPEYEPLRNGVEFFVTEYVISGQKSLKSKFRIARKAFNNVEGVLM